MKKKKVVIGIIFILLVALILLLIGFLLTSRYHVFKGHTLSKSERQAEKDIYYCPMHPNFTSDKPGSCAICGMTLVKKEKGHEEHAGMKKERKIIYYRNPMNSQVTSVVPAKDQMGMDYVPVYEEEADAREGGISINSERQQIIGVKKEKVEKRKLTYQILTVGRVAYDPGLYVAQEEYLQALKVKEKINESALPLIKEQIESLADAAKRKLMLSGMNEETIEELTKEGKPQESLYLPVKENTVWVYTTIYEYEIGLIKEGLPVEIDAIAFPGDVFTGKIVAITPVLDPITRSMQVRSEIDNPGHKLKPDMFVNVKINIDLGEKLAVSEEAVINTGRKTLVVVTNETGNFYSKEVRLGQKAEGFYEVLEGLKEGDTVVTSGNFLIDSESRLQSAISGEAGQEHGQ